VPRGGRGGLGAREGGGGGGQVTNVGLHRRDGSLDVCIGSWIWNIHESI
jgi:hypothetical protein